MPRKKGGALDQLRAELRVQSEATAITALEFRVKPRTDISKSMLLGTSSSLPGGGLPRNIYHVIHPVK